MTARNFAEDLETAAMRVGDLPRADLQVLLRRAALVIRNQAGAPVGAAVEAKVDDSVRSALGRAASDLELSADSALERIVRDWLIGHGYLAGPVIEEDSETDGSA